MDIWLSNADGSGQRKLTEGQCEQAAGPFWSRRGDKVACVSGGTTEAPLTKIAVFNLEGQTVAQAEHEAWLMSFAWSADDRHFVYIIAEGEALETARLSLVIGDTESEATVRLDDAQDARWSPDGGQLAYLKTAGEELAIYDLASGQTRSLGQGLRPLAWALGGKALLVAANFQQQEEFGANYEANLLDLASGEMVRVPELDNSTQFWLSRDGQAAAFLSGSAQRAEGGAAISILDLATRQATPIEGAAIGYPSEGIPSDHIAFSADGAYLYWVDVVTGEEGLSGTIYRAQSDGTGLTQLAVVKGMLFAFSPDRTMVLYSDGSTLSVAGVDGGNVRSLAEMTGGRWPPAAWRPLPTP
jgi:Tol biopolymer transport system component